MKSPRELCCLLLAASLTAACGSGPSEPPPPVANRETLLDPQSCHACHPGQYDEWAGSMHAYSSDDPVFLAMNARGQEETKGQLGQFCLNCHAPMAVREGVSEDGLNLPELGREYRGVTCYFCHNVERIEGLHNNPLILANDTTMRGPFSGAARNSAHTSMDSPHFDSARNESSELCGTCHDVTLPEALVGHEVKLERTYAEWQDSLFAGPHAQGGVGCVDCHMPDSPRRTRSAETSGAPERRSTRHDLEGVDLALVDFPNQERQRLLVERLLASTLLAEICVSETGVIEVTLENAGAGHHWPSGASHDREAWLAIEAFAKDQSEPVFHTVAPESADLDADRVVLKDHVVDADGNAAHMFWDVAEVESSTTLPSVATRDALDPEYHRERRIFTFNTNRSSAQELDRVTLTVRIRPIGGPILEDLVQSGHLDESTAQAMPVIDLTPDRCYDSALVERYPDILTSRSNCTGSDGDDNTLVWRDSEANESNRTFRVSRVDGAPARCLSHPTYVSVPSTP